MLINIIIQHLQQLFIEYLQYAWLQKMDFWMTVMFQVSNYLFFANNKLFYPLITIWGHRDCSHFTAK